MQDKVKKLRNLMIDLELGMTPEEIDENMSHLTEKEIDELIRNSEAVVQYQAKVSAVAKTVDEEKYEKIYQGFSDEMVNINDEYLNNLESLQEEADGLADAVEKKTHQQINAIVEETELDIQEVVVQVKETNEDLNKAILNNSS